MDTRPAGSHMLLTVQSEEKLRQKVMLEGVLVHVVSSTRPYTALLMLITPLSAGRTHSVSVTNIAHQPQAPVHDIIIIIISVD